MDIVYIICDLFVAGMAAFGLWCIFRFLMIDFSLGERICLSLSVSSSKELEKIDEDFEKAEHSPIFFSGKRVLLLEDEALLELVKSKHIDEYADIYIRQK